mgnify:CR=1 FL=1
MMSLSGASLAQRNPYPATRWKRRLHCRPSSRCRAVRAAGLVNFNMTKRMSLLKSICCLSVLLVAGCEAPETPTTATAQPPRNPTTIQAAKSLEETWQLFATAVIQNDVATIKALSAPKIRCVDCVTNTPKKEAAWKLYQNKNPDTWYDKLYKELADIDAGVFITDDLPIIFDERTKSRLLDKSKLVFLENQQTQEVLVTIMDPAAKGGFEGMQAAFAFEQTRAGYRFRGYSTIP